LDGGFSAGASPGVRQRFVIVGSRGQSARDGIEQHELQEADGRGNLRSVKTFDEFVSVLFFFLSRRHNVSLFSCAIPIPKS
jgi:hypothetical protein